MLQSQTRLCGQSAHSHDCSKVSVTARTFSRQVNLYTSQSVRGNQRTQAFCAYASFIHEAPGVSGLNSDHTGDSLREAFDEVVTEEWKLDIAKLAGITTYNASNNQKVFKDDYTWIPCFGHNLHLAVNKAINIDRVSADLSRLRRTISAFTRSSKLSRQLKTK